MSDFLAQGLDGGDAATAGGLCAVCVFLETVVVLPNKKCRCISVVNTEILMLKGFLFFVWQHILLQKTKNVGEYGDTHAQGLDGGATEACRGRVCFFFPHLILA